MRRGEGGWLSWKAIETGELALLGDYSSWKERRPLFESYPIHAIMVVPIKHRGGVVGTINILRNEPDKPFVDADVYVAEQLAQMVALVLDNANLYAQLQSELIDRRHAEQALRRSERSLTRAQHVAKTGHYEWDLETDTVTWSQEIYNILGFDSDSYLPTIESFMEFANLVDAAALSRESMERLINLDEHELEFRIVDQTSGEEKFVYLWGETTFDLNGEPKFVLGILQDISDRKYNEQAAVILAAFEERQRLARDLHDSVNQALHSLVLFSETATYNLEQGQIDKLDYSIDRMQVSARQALKEMRLMLYEMRSPWDAQFSLLEALEARLRAVESRAQIDAKLNVDTTLQLSEEIEEELFWIATEALNNALKHSQAEQVYIDIRNQDSKIVLEVIDNGVGFDPAHVKAGGMGLNTMMTRAAKIGGILAVVSAPGEGACIRLEAQMEEEQ
jgi:PAS domain S-box-containing protein